MQLYTRFFDQAFILFVVSVFKVPKDSALMKRVYNIMTSRYNVDRITRMRFFAHLLNVISPCNNPIAQCYSNYRAA